MSSNMWSSLPSESPEDRGDSPLAGWYPCCTQGMPLSSAIVALQAITLNPSALQVQRLLGNGGAQAKDAALAADIDCGLSCTQGKLCNLTRFALHQHNPCHVGRWHSRPASWVAALQGYHVQQVHSFCMSVSGPSAETQKMLCKSVSISPKHGRRSQW